MTYVQKENTGTLFINDKKGNDRAPDRKGTINVGGQEFELAGWMKEGKKGPFLSLSVKPKQARVNQSVDSDMDSEIPF